MSRELAALGAVIRQERKQRGLSQESYAALCELSRAYVGEVERGEANISFCTLLALSKGLNISLTEMSDNYERQAKQC